MHASAENPKPVSARAAARRRLARRARIAVAGLATAAFAWPFGFLIGQMHAGVDPGLSAPTVTGQATAQATSQPSAVSAPAPLVTRQS